MSDEGFPSWNEPRLTRPEITWIAMEGALTIPVARASLPPALVTNQRMCASEKRELPHRIDGALPGTLWSVVIER